MKKSQQGIVQADTHEAQLAGEGMIEAIENLKKLPELPNDELRALTNIVSN